jgi:hypothetical protein
MTGTANTTVHHLHSIALSEEQIFRLWCAAIKDDENQVDDIIRHVYRDMTKYNRERFEEILYLTITRDVGAERALAELLKDIAASGANTPPVPLH